MKVEYMSDCEDREKPVSNWGEVKALLEALDADERAYVILCRDNQDFMQVAGSPTECMVEVRLHRGADFQHFRLGKPTSANEALQLSDAIDLFERFFMQGTLLPGYAMRDIRGEMQ
ncbi:MAG TPA: hypothetical protein VHS96_03395 [Bacteroidia bacterium]|nr:hypothetical protein [Bacteroidia bacterium]